MTVYLLMTITEHYHSDSFDSFKFLYFNPQTGELNMNFENKMITEKLPNYCDNVGTNFSLPVQERSRLQASEYTNYVNPYSYRCICTTKVTQLGYRNAVVGFNNKII